jgi:hypothetical protein
MRFNSIVVVSLHTPREKFWGQLLEINSAGITVRGLDLSTFNEWLNQLKNPSPIGLATVFFPLHRVERVEADEPVGEVPSLTDTFLQQTGRTFREYLRTKAKGRRRL